MAGLTGDARIVAVEDVTMTWRSRWCFEAGDGVTRRVAREDVAEVKR